MITLEKVESIVNHIPCPICLNNRFLVSLSCESPGSPCDFHAECQHCHNKILITQDTKSMEEMWLSINQTIKEQGCPKCGDKKLNLEFLCDLESEDCFFIVKCKDNGHYSRFNNAGFRYLFH